MEESGVRCWPGNRKEGSEHRFEPTFCFIYCGGQRRTDVRAPALKHVAPVHGPSVRAGERSLRCRGGEREKERESEWVSE